MSRKLPPRLKDGRVEGSTIIDTTESIDVDKWVAADGDITSGGNVIATTGSVTAGNNVSATNTVSGTTVTA